MIHEHCKKNQLWKVQDMTTVVSPGNFSRFSWENCRSGWKNAGCHGCCHGDPGQFWIWSASEIPSVVILHIKRHLILMTITADLKKTNINQLWKPEFWKKDLIFCKKKKLGKIMEKSENPYWKFWLPQLLRIGLLALSARRDQSKISFDMPNHRCHFPRISYSQKSVAANVNHGPEVLGNV